MKKILVSVIMATLNTPSEFLFKSISSILNQTYNYFEFIIIVDGGNDEQYIKNTFKDERIILVKNKQSMGLPYSLNEGIKKSKGKYIARMDSDDISDRNRLMEQLSFMEKNPSIDMCASYYNNFGKINRKVREKYKHYDDVRSKLFFTNCIAHPSVFIRKSSLIDKNMLYNTDYKYSQDFELWNQRVDFKISIIPKCLFYYRTHNLQISSAKKQEQDKLYYSILENNLSKLNIKSTDLNYILFLNGRKKTNNFKDVYKFIGKLINANNDLKIYNIRSFRKVLKRQFEIYCIKNHCILN